MVDTQDPNRASKSEANAQNSEQSPEGHPSGARIEKMVHQRTGDGLGESPENLLDKEILRPSERYTPPLGAAEGGSDDVPASPHRQSPESRDS